MLGIHRHMPVWMRREQIASISAIRMAFWMEYEIRIPCTANASRDRRPIRKDVHFARLRHFTIIIYSYSIVYIIFFCMVQRMDRIISHVNICTGSKYPNKQNDECHMFVPLKSAPDRHGNTHNTYISCVMQYFLSFSSNSLKRLRHSRTSPSPEAKQTIQNLNKTVACILGY